MTRADIIHTMASVGASEFDPVPSNYAGFVDIFQRFAEKVAFRTLAHSAPGPIVIDASKADPAMLSDLLSRLPCNNPMRLEPLPLAPDVAAAVAAEREACAKLVESMVLASNGGTRVSAAIRARGNLPPPPTTIDHHPV